MSSSNEPPETNPFVAFRRLADAQIASMFNSISDPFRRNDETEFQRAQEDLWRRFEKSYERATNPTRTQTERGERAEQPKDSDTLPGFGRELEDPISAPYQASQSRRQDLERQRQGVFGRILGALGKTNPEEESIRMAGNQLKDMVRAQEQEDKARRDEIGMAIDRCPAVQGMYAEQERSEEIGRRMDRCPAVQEMYAEQEAPNEVCRRMEKCPWVQEQATGEGTERQTPYGMSWSWGPWGVELGSRRSRVEASDDKDGDTREEDWTLGPWSMGPMRMGPMRMGITVPKDLEADINEELTRALTGAFESVQQRRREFDDQVFTSQRRLESADATPHDEKADGQYAPTELMKREGFRGHRNWRQAFEDLVAAESGDVLLGGTPWSSAETESDESWRARLQDRGLYFDENEWHRRMMGLQEAPQTSQDAPHTELEFYDKLLETPQVKATEERPSILSTVTTVESVQNPDGSTTTKRTLKRRFSNGRVEKEETNESTPAPTPSLAARAPEDTPKPTMAEQLKRDQGTKGSWFWS